MNTQHTVDQLKSLKLNGMAKRYEAILLLPVHELQDVHSLVGMRHTSRSGNPRPHTYAKVPQIRASFAIMPCRRRYSVHT